ncbi:CDGSH iron-sulfur domain-containing protein [Nonomuraea sp. NPDC050556]|uniref:CDGSH iron-sulfur domain-containing protein n=1 Tax=Nonomuraea sp. NPDC050556 TaxID=3364369 RepID=UPI00378A8CE6
MRISVTENGPYEVSGGVPLAVQEIVADEAGESVSWREGRAFPGKASYALCRCGQSGNKPFCDGSHATTGFDGTETATREPYLSQAGEQDGPDLTLTDAEPLCAFARFCDYGGQIWNLVEEPGQADLVEREAANCPSGRLVAWRLAERQALEPELPPSIGLVEDPAQGVSGPLWVRGGVTVTAADGTEYERRNRVTLCRCGASRNKPFCDGSHAAVGFKDDL